MLTYQAWINSRFLLKPFLNLNLYFNFQNRATKRKIRNYAAIKRIFSLTSKSATGKASLSRKLSLALLSGIGLCANKTVVSKSLRLVHCRHRGVDGVDQLLDDIIGEKTTEKFRLKDIVKLLSSEIWLLLSSVLCAAVAALINVKIPLLIGNIVNVLSEYAADSSSSFLQDIRGPALRLLFVYLAQAAWTFSYISLVTLVGERIAMKLRTKLFESLLRQDVDFYDRNKTGVLLDRLTTDIQDFKSSFKSCLSQGLKAVMQTLGCTVSMAYVSPQLTLVLAIVLPTIILLGTVIGSALRQLSRRAQSQIAYSTGVAEEALGNFRTVRAFAMEPKEALLYRGEVSKAEKLNMHLGFGIAIFQALTNIVVNGIVLGVLFAGGLLVSNHQLSPGDLMSFLIATQTIQKSLAQISVLYSQAIKGATAAVRIFEYISLKPRVSLTGGLTIPYHSLNGHVSFKDINFAYPTRPEQVVLKDFSLDIKGGQTGGGKSTAAVLLERFYDVTAGSITIDGHDIRRMNPSWLRGKAIGFINQEPILFATTVMENIRYGKPSATDIEVMEAAQQANAHDFIMKFPRGYRTVVGEKGVALSGGQKQRVAIARALIKQPSILILDEATSALDAESEKVVQEALENASRGRTVIVIAHRLSTVKHADLIAVVADGRIIESGKHEDLWQKKGAYWKLVRQQNPDRDLD